MTFRVMITENAKDNLRHYFDWSARNTPDNAERWLNRFQEALQTLSENPQRCSLAPENDVVQEEIRHFLFGKRVGTFRVLFRIVDDEVRILHIRRAAMRDATPDDLAD